MCERNYNGYWHLKGKFNKEKVFAWKCIRNWFYNLIWY
jgi:hypothetical protein